jgi:probable F420-dependent oxidoreductase
VVVADHLVDGLPDPFVTLAAMGAATTRLHVGTLVLNNDFRHPALVARAAATLDELTDGRCELGLGAGHAFPEYQEIGIEFDPPGPRVSRLVEAAMITRELFDGDKVYVVTDHYRLDGHQLYPAQRPRLLIGGNGDRVLACGARVADIVGFTGLGRTRSDGQRHDTEWAPEQIDRKVAMVRAAARDRDVEFNALVQYVEITDDRESAAARLPTGLGGDPADFLTTPYVWLGTVAEIVDQLLAARERWGFSYFVTRDADATAAVMAAMPR